MSIDWAEIAARAQAELEASKQQRERLRAIEERHAERDRRRPPPTITTVRNPPAPPEMTPAERKAAAAASLFTWMTQAAPVEEPTPTPPPDAGEAQKPVAGTMAARIAKRETKQKAIADERAAAQETLARMIRSMGR